MDAATSLDNCMRHQRYKILPGFYDFPDLLTVLKPQPAVLNHSQLSQALAPLTKSILQKA